MKTIRYNNRVESLNDEGELHSFDDKPSVIYNDGNKVWHKNGKHHRVGGPAIERINGDKFWYKEGKIHRLDGPARIFVARVLRGRKFNSFKEWWYDGEELEGCDSTEEFRKALNIKGNNMSEDYTK